MTNSREEVRLIMADIVARHAYLRRVAEEAARQEEKKHQKDRHTQRVKPKPPKRNRTSRVGIPLSEEHKAKLREAAKHRKSRGPQTEIAKARISLALKRFVPAKCHPNLPNRAKGLCTRCYQRQWMRERRRKMREKNPAKPSKEIRKAQSEGMKRYWAEYRRQHGQVDTR